MPGTETARTGLNRTRIFLLVFFGIAAALIVTTIVGTLRNMDEQKLRENQPAVSAPAAPAAQ